MCIKMLEADVQNSIVVCHCAVGFWITISFFLMYIFKVIK